MALIARATAADVMPPSFDVSVPPLRTRATIRTIRGEGEHPFSNLARPRAARELLLRPSGPEASSDQCSAVLNATTRTGSPYCPDIRLPARAGRCIHATLLCC